MVSDRQRFERARKALHWTRAVTAGYLDCTVNAIFRYETAHEDHQRAVPPHALDWIEAVARDFREMMKRHPRPKAEP